MQKKIYGPSVHPNGERWGRIRTFNNGFGRFLNENRRALVKLGRVMRLSAFLLTAAFIHAHAAGIGQTVTLSGKDIPLQEVFTVIEKQTGYVVFGKLQLLQKAKPVTITVRSMPLPAFLDTVLKNQQIAYSIKGRTISLSPRANEPPGIVETGNNIPPPQKIEGRVLNSNGQPLAGVSVMVRGGKRGTITNADGVFSIDANDGEILEVSCIGFSSLTLQLSEGAFRSLSRKTYNQQNNDLPDARLAAARNEDDVPLDGKPAIQEISRLVSGIPTNIIVSLAVKTSSLDNVQIIAYATTTQRKNTGNVSTVKGAELEKSPVNNPFLALQGRVTGVFIEQATGLAGTGVKVRIQGQNSLSSGNDPLYVVDGVPYTSQNLPAGPGVSILGSSGSNGPGSPLSYINMNDIESIDVLKDADATAIYGSRAANGAILITTKKGSIGQTKVNFNLQNGWGTVAHMLPLLNTQQYLQMRHEALQNQGKTPGPTDYDLNGEWDTTRNIDWQKELIGGTARFTDVQATVSGGTASTQYLVGAGYHRETTVMPGDWANQKMSLHFNISNTSPNKRFKTQLLGNYMYNDNRLLNSDLTGVAIILPPNAPELYKADGTLNWQQVGGNSTWSNPLSAIGTKNRINTHNLIAKALFSYTILKGLEAKLSAGFTNLQNSEILTYPLTGYAPESLVWATGQAFFQNGTIRSYILEPQLSYQTKIGKGTLELLSGMSMQQNITSVNIFLTYGYTSDLLIENLSAAPYIIPVNTSEIAYKYQGVFGRLNYNYRQKYILSLNIRRDGSSRFGSENQFHNFGSVAGAWVFSKENFFKDLRSFISFGKLKASYGTTGNDQIGDYQFLSRYNTQNRSQPYQGSIGLTPAGLPNPYLQWEETRKLNLGIDLGLLNERILLSVNHYINRSSNQLQGYALPLITGFGDITENFDATVQNTGTEFGLNTTNIDTRNFSWSSSFNLTFQKNKLVEYKDLASSSNASTYIIGQPITIARLYNFAGVDPATGLYQFYDKDNNLTNNPNYNTDRTVVVDLLPKFYGGFQNALTYKDFRLDVLFQFVKQVAPAYNLGSQPGYFYSDAFAARGNQPTYVLSRWQKAGDLAAQQQFSATYPSAINNPYSKALLSEARYKDASYVRLKNVSVSWQVPLSGRLKTVLQNARIYAQGQNLLTFTKFEGIDPETKGSGTLPPLRVITLGVQFTL